MFSPTAISILSLVAVAGILGQAIVPTKPNIAMLDVQDNFEFGTTTKSFRVQYPGICDVDLNETVEIKIKSISSSAAKPVHSFKVPIDDIPNGKVYYFGLKDALPGKYSVEVCVNQLCSDISKSLTAILSHSEIPQLTCHKVTKQKETKLEKATWEILSKNAGPITVTTTSVPRLMTITELDNQPAHLIWGREKKGEVCHSNPCYFNGELYINYRYNISHYSELFIDPKVVKAAVDKVPITVADDYCGRKYLLSTNVHLLNPITKEVKYRFKTTLNEEIPVFIRDKYMFPDQAEAGFSEYQLGVPVERVYVENIVEGKYDVWVADCFTDKDKVDSTICSDSFVLENAVIGSGVNSAEESVLKKTNVSEA